MDALCLSVVYVSLRIVIDTSFEFYTAHHIDSLFFSLFFSGHFITLFIHQTHMCQRLLMMLESLVMTNKMNVPAIMNIIV